MNVDRPLRPVAHTLTKRPPLAIAVLYRLKSVQTLVAEARPQGRQTPHINATAVGRRRLRPRLFTELYPLPYADKTPSEDRMRPRRLARLEEGAPPPIALPGLLRNTDTPELRPAASNIIAPPRRRPRPSLRKPQERQLTGGPKQNIRLVDPRRLRRPVRPVEVPRRDAANRLLGLPLEEHGRK